MQQATPRSKELKETYVCYQFKTTKELSGSVTVSLILCLPMKVISISLFIIFSSQLYKLCLLDTCVTCYALNSNDAVSNNAKLNYNKVLYRNESNSLVLYHFLLFSCEASESKLSGAESEKPDATFLPLEACWSGMYFSLQTAKCI